MTAPAIEVRDLTVRYGEVVALDGVDVRIDPGRVCALVGMNGSGKSTLFKSIIGLVRPVRGGVLVHGEPPARARARGMLGYVPQSEEVDRRFPVSVRDVATMGRYGRLGITRRPRAEDRAAVDEALARTDLADLADRQIGRLSGGQRKRAFVARGLAQGARVLLLDEPFAGVDAPSEATISRVLRELVDDGGTVLISVHDLGAARRLADDALLLDRRVVAAGPAAETLTADNVARAFGLGGLDELPGGAS